MASACVTIRSDTNFPWTVGSDFECDPILPKHQPLPLDLDTSPRAPTCWKSFLRLKNTKTASSSSEPPNRSLINILMSPKDTCRSDTDSVSTSSRLSLSSSSDDNNTPKQQTSSSTTTVLADSPRLNSSGKVVFQGLERSSSSPGSFNGGPRYKHGGGIERSYSAHVRVLNVPLISRRKFRFSSETKIRIQRRNNNNTTRNNNHQA